MLKLNFIRPQKYTYLVEGKDLYDSFNLVAKGQVDPWLDTTGVKTNGLQETASVGTLTATEKHKVYSSPAKRARQTAELITLDYEVLPELAEIKFTMEEIMSKQQFLSLSEVSRVNDLRRAFFERLIASELSESFAEVLARVDRLIELIRQDTPSAAYICSHSFFMKVAEIYLQYPEVRHKPSSLFDYYDPAELAYNFAGGFSISLE